MRFPAIGTNSFGLTQLLAAASVATSLAFSAGCKPPAKVPVAPQKSSDSSSLSSQDQYEYEDDEESQGSVAANCDPGSCKKKKITISLRDGQSGDKVSSFKGKTNTENVVVFEAVSSDRGRTVLLSVDGLPGDADENSQNNSLTATWTPSEETSGSFTVTARDVSRCLADADGKRSKEEKCEDMGEDEFEEYETTDTFSYSITYDAETKAQKEQEKALKAQQKALCTAAMLQGGIGMISGIVQSSQYNQQPNVGGMIGQMGQAAIPCLAQ